MYQYIIFKNCQDIIQPLIVETPLVSPKDIFYYDRNPKAVTFFQFWDKNGRHIKLSRCIGSSKIMYTSSGSPLMFG